MGILKILFLLITILGLGVSIAQRLPESPQASKEHIMIGPGYQWPIVKMEMKEEKHAYDQGFNWISFPSL